MKSFLTKYKKTYIFFGTSLLIYFTQDLLFLTLQVKHVEIAAISFFLSLAMLFVSFCSLLIVTIKGRLRYPGVISGLLIFFTCNFIYTQLLTEAKVDLYYHMHEEDLNSLIQEVLILGNDSELVRSSNDHDFLFLSHMEAFLADKQPLESLMETLHVYSIKKHSNYIEFSVSGYTFGRLKELALFYSLNEDGMQKLAEDKSQESVVESSHIEDNWHYIVYNYKSLDDRHARWGHKSKQRADNFSTK